ncbi:DMT family transporter [Saccharopolyspora rosea]|uniref:DMT family transporter n=1 Tax=Saccharopolyspora rosea TaxID=524884 RepID=UPI0021D94511|nr:DMT family transporter [Saccharopolyspora rosea]
MTVTRERTGVQPSKGQRALGMAGAALVGVLLALQSRLNGALGARLDDGLAAGVISFGGGFVVLAVCTAAIPSARRGVALLVTEVRGPDGLRAWQCLGGVCGGYLVFSQGMAASALGVALFTVAVVAGQVSSGLVVDRFGLGPGGPQRVTVARMAGAALAVVAVVLSVSAQLGGVHGSWLVVLPALAGIGLGWQAAVNGRVKQVAGSAVTAATLNFAVGTLSLGLAFVLELLVRGAPRAFPPQPWLYVGGLLGIFVIGGSVALVRYTGVLLLSLGMIAGQLVGALLLDVFGPGVATSTVVGVLLTLVAVGVAALPDRAGRAARGLPR